MKTSDTTLVYLDLFDDEIWDSTIRRKSATTPLEDTSRFKILLALISGKTVVVPEQWAASSPLFLRLAAEIVPIYLERRAAGDVMQMPFVIACFASRAASGSFFKAAMLERLRDSGRRLKISDSVDLDFNPAANETRQRVAQCIEDLSPFDPALEEQLGLLLGDRTVAQGIVSILKYCTLPGSEIGFDGRHYALGLSEHFQRVRQFVCNDIEWIADAVDKSEHDNIVPITHDEVEIIDSFKDFFSNDDLLKNDAAYVKAWAHAKSAYTAEAYTFIEIIGRIGMHASLGRSVQSNVSSHIHARFKSQEKSRALVEFFCNYLFGMSSEDAKAIQYSSIISKEFLYDDLRAGPIDWRAVWHSTLELSSDRKWTDMLAMDESRVLLLNETSPDKVDHYMRDLVERNIAYLNEKLKGVRFEADRSTSRIGGGFYMKSWSGMAAAALAGGGATAAAVAVPPTNSVQLLSTVLTLGSIGIGTLQNVGFTRVVRSEDTSATGRILNVGSKS